MTIKERLCPNGAAFYKIALYALMLSFGALAVTSCAEREVAADSLLEHARRLEKSDPQAALLALDSIHEIFPRDVNVRRQADTIEWRINYAQAVKSLPYVDSLLQEDNSRLSETSMHFEHLSSDYQDLGTWEHQNFKTEKNTTRCYLKPTVDDYGQMVVMSFYIGPKAAHTSIVISIDGTERQSGDVDDEHTFTDEGGFHELLSFDDPLQNGLTSFITDTEGRVVKVTLKGDHETTYTMPQRDREAFVETIRLASLLHEMRELTIQKTKFTRQIKLLGKRINRKEK